jgi:hypothetical protein
VIALVGFDLFAFGLSCGFTGVIAGLLLSVVGGD